MDYFLDEKGRNIHSQLRPPVIYFFLRWDFPPVFPYYRTGGIIAAVRCAVLRCALGQSRVSERIAVSIITIAKSFIRGVFHALHYTQAHAERQSPHDKLLLNLLVECEY